MLWITIIHDASASDETSWEDPPILFTLFHGNLMNFQTSNIYYRFVTNMVSRTMHVVIYLKCLPQICTKRHDFQSEPLPRPIPRLFSGCIHLSQSVRVSPSNLRRYTLLRLQSASKTIDSGFTKISCSSGELEFDVTSSNQFLNPSSGSCLAWTDLILEFRKKASFHNKLFIELQ